MSNLFNIFYENLYENSESIFSICCTKEKEFFVKKYQILNYIYDFNIKYGFSNCHERIGISINNSNYFICNYISAILNGFVPVLFSDEIETRELEKIIQENNIKIVIDKANCIKLNEKRLIFNMDFIKNLNLEDIITISYTSGTSSIYSKGVYHTLNNIDYTSKMYNKLYGMKEEDIILCAMPLFYNFGLFACLTNAIYTNCKIVLMEKWDLDIFYKLYDKYHITIFPGSPYMYMDIINFNQSHDLSKIRVCDCGGDFLMTSSILKFEKLSHAKIIEGYGLTETTSLTHFNIDAENRIIGSIGKAIPKAECKILDLKGNIVKNGKWGLLWIKGPMVSPGYVDGTKIEEWFNTGDVVKKIGQNYYLAGRFSELKILDETNDNIIEVKDYIYKNYSLTRLFFKIEAINPNIEYSLIIEQYNEKLLDKDLLITKLNNKFDSLKCISIEVVNNVIKTYSGKIKRTKLNERKKAN